LNSTGTQWGPAVGSSEGSGELSAGRLLNFWDRL